MDGQQVFNSCNQDNSIPENIYDFEGDENSTASGFYKLFLGGLYYMVKFQQT